MAHSHQSFNKPAAPPPINSPSGSAPRTGRTFAVSPVTPETEPFSEIPYYRAVSEFLGGQVEACSSYHGELISCGRLHPLIAAVHLAFATHRPLSLSPDIIWLTLTQGLACHINANSEALRHHFVKHAGKLEIEVRRDDFIKGSPENPWPEVFQAFSAGVRKYIGDAHSLIVADFSTTGPVERAASEIVLLDAMQAYFTYILHTLCGIPSITLEGTVADWQSIADRATRFRQFGLDWWLDALEPILNQFVAAANGKIDQPFWDSIYKSGGGGGSGASPFVTGWLLNLFPYLIPATSEHRSESKAAAAFYPNPWITSPPAKDDGPGPDHFPRFPAKAPFVWKFADASFQMEFIGGLIGIRQDPQTLSLRPEIGWAVWEVGAEERKRQADVEECKRRLADLEQQRIDNERIRMEKVAAAATPTAIHNRQAHTQFLAARKLGRQFHELYTALSLATSPSQDPNDHSEAPLLLDLAQHAYQTNPDFQRLWHLVHSDSPDATHTHWLSLWKRL